MKSLQVPILVLATISCSLLPSVSLGAGVIAYGIFADVSALPYSALVNELESKSMAYWFLALASIAIASWTWIVKWLISQLDSQRSANAETTTRLIEYMEKDHADMRAIMSRTTEVLDRVLMKLSL